MRLIIILTHRLHKSIASYAQVCVINTLPLRDPSRVIVGATGAMCQVGKRDLTHASLWGKQCLREMERSDERHPASAVQQGVGGEPRKRAMTVFEAYVKSKPCLTLCPY